MATIAKFYLHDAATPNTGTMPSGALRVNRGAVGTANTGDATGARTARTANDTIGTANPDTESTLNSNADTNQQQWGHRRFVSPPLAARTFAAGDGNWTFSFAASEGNAAHNGLIAVCIYGWRPSAGVEVGDPTLACAVVGGGSEAGTSETAISATAAWKATSLTILDGDILVFDVTSQFTQSMGVSYADNFAYDGTTEASTTTCASYVTPPAAVTLYTPPQLSLAYFDRRVTRNTLLRR